MEWVDTEGNTTIWTHDELRPVLEASVDFGSSASKKCTWGFGGNDRRTTHKGDGNNETTWAFNARARVTTETYADTGAGE